MIEKRNNSNFINLGNKVKPFAIENDFQTQFQKFAKDLTTRLPTIILTQTHKLLTYREYYRTDRWKSY